MTDIPQREMTLKEWVERLPPEHTARKEYEALQRPQVDVESLKRECRVEYPDDLALQKLVNDYIDLTIDKIASRGLIAQGWRDIESAPRDGTKFIFRTEGDHVGMGRFQRHTFIGGSKSGFRALDGFYAEPTHWMPLPSHPEPQVRRPKHPRQSA